MIELTQFSTRFLYRCEKRPACKILFQVYPGPGDRIGNRILVYVVIYLLTVSMEDWSKFCNSE